MKFSPLETLINGGAPTDEMLAERERDDQERYGKPEFTADVKRWAAMACWDIEDAAALSMGKEPFFFRRALPPRENFKQSPLVWEFSCRQNSIRSAIKAGLLSAIPARDEEETETILSRQFVEWADLGAMEMPADLIAEVRGRQQLLEAPRDLAGADRETLMKEVARLRAENDQLRRCVDELRKVDLADTERRSLQKMILGMALSKYEYGTHGKRSETAAKIEGDLQRVDIQLSKKTIFDKLSQAHDIVFG